MAYANASLSHTNGFVARNVARVAALFTDLAERAARRQVYIQTRNELRNLSVRELTDLGLNPSMVDSIAYEAAYGK